MEQDSLLRRKYPQLGTLDDFEAELQQKIKESEARQRSGRTTATVITIPVVVHVIHNGEAVGQGRNLSAQQIESQLQVLNEDFRRVPGTPGFNENPAGADVEIEFCLASVNPQGRPMAERGIDRVRQNKASWTRTEIENTIKPSTIWDPNKYYNIWVLEFAAADNQLVGYAQFPIRSGLAGLPTDDGSGTTDGVVVRYSSFGSVAKGNFPVLQAPYNRGRTLSHETGHWLGLRHIWGDGACGDDFCADTPPQSSESRGCSVGRTSRCNGVDYTNLVQNYMDYSDDACMNIFTRDQKNRMRRVMELSPRRRELVSSAVCGNLIASRPIANFRASRERVLLGSTVTFTDLSSRFPTRRLWTFEGGTPVTSTELNPTVTYTTPGKFKVTLEVYNAVGGDTLVREKYIEVLNAGLCGGLTNFINDVDTSKPATPTLLRVPPPGKGYVSGHNSLRDRARSEFFGNDLGYTNMDGVAIRFGAVYASGPEAVATVTVWNARGVQGGPGQVLERKQVPLSVIAQDVARGAPTQVSFERNVPINGFPFHVGVEFNYNGDSLAIITTANGESNFATSWRQDSTGRWDRYTTSLGLNVAHAIRASVGVKSSVQVFASSLYINAGETVTLSARGTNLYAWQSPNNDLNTTLGPQVIAQPTQTTTYTVTGGGDLCNATARVTVYVRNPTALSPEALERQLTVYPNPGHGVFVLDVVNNLTGAVEIGVYNAVGRQLSRSRDAKTGETFRKTLDLSTLPGGVYFVEFTLGELKVRKKVVKL